MLLEIHPKSFPVVHHIELVHQNFYCHHDLLEVFVEDLLAFCLVELLLIGLVDHLTHHLVQDVEVTFGIDLLIFVDPAAVSLELVVNRSLGPIGTPQNLHELVEVALFEKSFFPLLWI